MEAYVRMRCDPGMMAELGGAHRPEDMPDKVRRDVAAVAEDRQWIKMILAGAGDGEVAGTVSLWTPEEPGAAGSEIGWMVLPEFQGRGLAKAAVREVLAAAARDGRWGAIHAFPSRTNDPSNGLCRSLGFTDAGEHELDYYGNRLVTRHWVLEPGRD